MSRKDLGRAVRSVVETLESRTLLASVTSAIFDYSDSPHKLAVQFSADVGSSLDESDFVIDNLTTDQSVPDTQRSLSYNTSTNVATITFDGVESEFDLAGVLPTGWYGVTIDKDDVHASGESALSADFKDDFSFMASDSDGNATIDWHEEDLMYYTGGPGYYSEGEPATFDIGDFNYNGEYDQGDRDIYDMQSGAFLGSPFAAPGTISLSVYLYEKITINWTDNVAGETGWRVQRSTDGVNFDAYTNIAANSTSLTWDYLTPGQRYWFRARAYETNPEESGYTAYSTKKSATALLSGPTSEATQVSNSRAKIDIYPPSNMSPGMIHGYQIWVNFDATEYELHDVVPAPASGPLTYDFFSAAEGSYQFAVKAVNQDTTSTLMVTSLGANDFYMTQAPLPDAPSSLSATPDEGDSEITLAWTDNSDNERSFIIEYSEDGEWFMPLDEIGENVTTYTHDSAERGLRYWYRVGAYNPAGTSSAGIVYAGLTLEEPSALAVTAPNGTEINLSWADNSKHELGFDIYQTTGTGQPVWVALAPPFPWDEGGYTITGLTPGTSYSYKVSARGAYTYSSDFSATASATTDTRRDAANGSETVYETHANAATLYPDAEWRDASNSVIQLAKNGLGNETITLTITDLPSHTYLSLSMIVYGTSPTSQESSRGSITVNAGGASIPVVDEGHGMVDSGTGVWHWQDNWTVNSTIAHTGETLTLTVSGSDFTSGYTWEAWHASVAAVLPTVTFFEGVDMEAGKAPNPDNSPDTASFTVYRTGPTVGDLVIALHPPAGIAVYGAEYTTDPAIESITIPDGESSVEVIVTAEQHAKKGNAYAQLLLKGNATYRIAGQRIVNVAAKQEDLLVVLVSGWLVWDPDGTGIWKLRQKLLDAGIPEDNILTLTEGGAREKIVNEVTAWVAKTPETPLKLMMIGHSFGGGAIYEASVLLNAKQSLTGKYNLSLTGYIDAIKQPSAGVAETRRPIGTARHINFFQTGGWPHGGNSAGTFENHNVDANGERETHTSIDDDDDTVLEGLKKAVLDAR